MSIVTEFRKGFPSKTVEDETGFKRTFHLVWTMAPAMDVEAYSLNEAIIKSGKGEPWESHIIKGGRGGLSVEWISVKDEMPEVHEEVLVYNKGGSSPNTIGVAWIEGSGMTSFDHAEGGYYDVTHWMPLPEPPKESKP